MKKILVGYLSNPNRSGISNYLMKFYDAQDKKEVHIDFLTKVEDSDLPEKIKKSDSKIFWLPGNKHLLTQFRKMRKILKENKYDIAYFNISESFNCIGIITAKMYGVKEIIIHSHSSNTEHTSIIKRLMFKTLNKLFKILLLDCSTKNLACSKKAAEWLYCKETVENNNYQFIPNCVDDKRFEYDYETRIKLRKQYKVDDKFVIGHIGRFSDTKNHTFLLDVFKDLLKERPNSRLFLIGEGTLKEQVKEYTRKLDIEEKVVFVGTVKNVEDYFQMFDVFILPSKFEGLPVVGIEAQFSNLPVLFSNTITDEVKISKNCEFLSIHNKSEWVDKLKEITTRENELLENAEHFKLKNSTKILKKIIEPTNNENNMFIGPLLLNIFLIIHYILNITCLYNGFNKLMVVVGILMLLITGRIFYNLCKNKKSLLSIFKDKEVVLSLLFLGSYLLTLIVTTLGYYDKLSFISGSKTFIWMILQIIYIFLLRKFNNIDQFKVSLKIVSIIILFITTIINIKNIYLLLTGVSSVVKSIDGQYLLYGLSNWGRFYGTYYDPNYASILCITSILIAIFFIKNTKGIILKLLCILSVLIQYIYIVFGQSRTALLTLVVGLLIYYSLRFVSKLMNNKYNKKVFVGNFMILIVCLLAISFVLPKRMLNIYNEYEIFIHEKEEVKYNKKVKEVINEDTKYNKKVKELENEEIKPKKAGRTDIGNDISNRRFSIWNSGKEIFITSPIYGVNPGYIIKYAEKVLPHTYIVNNDFSKFSLFHNFIIDVLVFQGLFGTLIFILFAVHLLTITLKNIKKILTDDNCKENILVLSICSMIIFSGLFLSVIFYINNICTYLFWLYLGYYRYYEQKNLGGSNNEKNSRNSCNI